MEEEKAIKKNTANRKGRRGESRKIYLWEKHEGQNYQKQKKDNKE